MVTREVLHFLEREVLASSNELEGESEILGVGEAH